MLRPKGAAPPRCAVVPWAPRARSSGAREPSRSSRRNTFRSACRDAARPEPSVAAARRPCCCAGGAPRCSDLSRYSTNIIKRDRQSGAGGGASRRPASRPSSAPAWLPAIPAPPAVQRLLYNELQLLGAASSQLQLSGRRQDLLSAHRARIAVDPLCGQACEVQQRRIDLQPLDNDLGAAARRALVPARIQPLQCAARLSGCLGRRWRDTQSARAARLHASRSLWDRVSGDIGLRCRGVPLLRVL
jgi:hypothetical protein